LINEILYLAKEAGQMNLEQVNFDLSICLENIL